MTTNTNREEAIARIMAVSQLKAEAVKYWLTTEPSGESGQLVTECDQLITAHNCAFPRIAAHNQEGTT